MAVRHPYLIRPRSTDSALRLCALSRMCIALYRKSFVDGGLQGVSAVQAACVRQSNELFQAMEQHIRHSSRIDEQCRLLAELHSLTGETDYVVNPRKQEAWDMCAGEVLDRFFSLSAPVAPATVSAACRVLLDLFYFSVPDDDDAWWLFLKNTLSAWASAFSDTEGWGNALPLADALERVELLNRYSYMYLDRTHDNVLRRAYRFYTNLASDNLHACSDVALGCLYNLALEGNAWQADRDLALRALETLQNRGTQLSPESDAGFYIRSWQADWQCRTEMQESVSNLTAAL